MWDTRKSHSLLNQSPDAAFPGFKRTWSFAVTPLDQLRLRLTNHDYDRLMQSAKPVPVPDREQTSTATIPSAMHSRSSAKRATCCSLQWVRLALYYRRSRCDLQMQRLGGHRDIANQIVSADK